MGLVDHETGDVKAPQGVEEAGGTDALRRQVEEAQLAGGGLLQGGVAFLGAHLAVEARRRDTELGEAGDLVHHQRDQRRDHDRQAAANDAGHPVGDALSRPRGGDEEHVGAGLGRGHHLALSGAEIGQPEDVREDAARFSRRLPRRGERRRSGHLSTLAGRPE